MPRSGRRAKLSKALLCRVREGALASVASLLLAAGLAGCGGASATPSNSSSREVVARVGAVAIDRATVEHWARAIQRGNSVATALGKISGTPPQRALGFLISANWILGEAEEQGLAISNAAVERQLQQKIDTVPNGRAEFQEDLASTGQTLADVRLEVSSRLAVSRLREAVARRVQAVTAAQVAGYYSRHRGSFYLPDRRIVYLIEGIHEYRHALALARRVRPGARLTLPWFREVVSRTPEVADRGALAHMVFAATPGRVAGPAMFFGDWVLAVVRKLIPAGIQPLSAVRGELSKTLTVQRREQTLERFAAAFVRRWTRRTLCSPGYVVQKCSQYRGVLAQGNPLVEG
jgi:hypothetical protein